MTISPSDQEKGLGLTPDANGDLHYSVVGRWPFPAIMLVTDQSEPATSEDAAIVESLTHEHAPDRGFMHEDHTVNLVIRGAGRLRPNTARWESFQWFVPEDLVHALTKDGKLKDAQRKALVKSALAKLSTDEVEALVWHGLKLDPV